MGPQPFTSAIAIGFASGLRSATGIAAFLHTRFARTPNSALADGVAAAAIVGESIVDKLPTTPSRLEFPAILARPAAGALGAYGLARGGDRNTVVLAVAIGSVAAVVGSYVGAAYRSAASTKVPPVAGALAEDVVANALAYSAIASVRP